MGTIRTRLVVVALCLLPALPHPLAGQSTLVGTVRDDATGAGLAGVVIEVEGTGQTMQSGPSGRFELSGLAAGNQVIAFRLLGFRPLRAQVQLRAGDTTRYDTRLVRQPVQQLDSVSVTGAPSTRGVGLGREAFNERRDRGFGIFLDTEELQRNEHRRLSDLFRGMNGISVIRYRECTKVQPIICGSPEERAGSRRGETSMVRVGRDDYCWMSVFMDGRLLYKSGSSMKVPDLSRDIPIASLDMVEVYRSAGETPGEYSGAGGTCGVILFWSKRAP